MPLPLAAYGPPFDALRWRPVGGGYSGAAVYAGSSNDDAPAFALKGYPPGYPADRLRQIHRWQAAAGHLPFVPALVPTRAGATFAEADGRLWELSAWMPGAADFRSHPSDARLAAACAAVAALHRAWEPATPTLAPFPAVARRLAVLADWRSAGLPSAVVSRWAGWAERELAPLAGRPVAVRPCLCDVHHDHVLFAGDAVSGVIDYGAMKADHPAVDLARLLGDLVPDDAARVRAGVAAYHAAGGSPAVTPELVTLLDRTGAVGGAAFWLLRGGGDRLDRLTQRLSRWGLAPGRG
jgi:Ser/Thr protein kinase RdoA (MazF antagonist)